MNICHLCILIYDGDRIKTVSTSAGCDKIYKVFLHTQKIQIFVQRSDLDPPPSLSSSQTKPSKVSQATVKPFSLVRLSSFSYQSTYLCVPTPGGRAPFAHPLNMPLDPPLVRCKKDLRLQRCVARLDLLPTHTTTNENLRKKSF